MTENDVVQAVAAHLVTEGYRIAEAHTTDERGVDIVAVHPVTAERLFVEAKGGTSSKEETARFGKPFTRNQAKSHVSVAFYYAAKLRQQHSTHDVRVAMAFPDDSNHRALVNDISNSLGLLGIAVFFVDSVRRVTKFGE